MIIRSSPNIEKAKIVYRDEQLKDLLYKAGRMPAGRSNIRGDLSGYLNKKISLAYLRNKNVLCEYSPMEKNICRLTNDAAAPENAILFSSNGRIKTGAVYCLSIMLFCRDKRIASAIHISAGLIAESFLHQHTKEMLLYGYANLKKLTGNKPILAYITGGSVTFDGDTAVDNNRKVLEILLPVIISRGIKIKRLELGGYYSCQELNLGTGVYKVFLNNGTWKLPA